jgi:cell division protein FtsI/penicillin-binding protein 2
MARRLQYQRLLLLALLLGAAFAGLGYRLVDLQVLRHEELLVKAQQNTQREFLREPRRGDILDVKGNLLATSTLVKRVCADPTMAGDRYPEMARLLAPVLRLPADLLAEQLKPRVVGRGTNGQPVFDSYVVLKKKVRLEEWAAVQNTLTNQAFGFDLKHLSKTNALTLRNLRAAIFAEDEQLREYPNQTLAAHVLGYVGMDERGADGISGKDGIELTLDSKLAGVHGWRVTEKDHRGRELVALRDQDVEARDGLNVVLTIDSVIQHLVESALADAMEKHTPISIAGLAIRPRTGEILAMATLPNFDPNKPGSAPADARRNRVIADIMEPGSTFKIVVVSGALNDGVVQLSDTFDCEHGHFAFAGHILHDHEPYGVLSAENIITKSSNIGAAKIGIKLGENRLYDYVRSYGFGARTSIPLSGEVPGISYPVKKWTKVSVAQIPMGQGVAVTRLQMAMAMCAIANNGWLMQPMLVDRLEDRDGNVVAKYKPQRVRQVISDSAAKLMVTALKTVVSSDGTAAKAALEHYTAAGKTGTAQKAGVGGYMPGKYIASFIGFFPADNPELCISVVMDEPKEGYYGGQVAAPIFKQIAESAANYLNIRPENGGEQPAMPDSITAPSDHRSSKTVAARSSTNP